MSKLISLENLGSFVNVLGIDPALNNSEESEITSKEKLEHSIEEILSEYIDLMSLDIDKNLTLRQKEHSIKVLFDKGIFNIKGAIPIVAKFLKMSVPSVYRHLKLIKNKE